MRKIPEGVTIFHPLARFILVVVLSTFLSLQASTLRISLKAHHTPLRTVLEKLSHLYQIDILFADELVEGIQVDCTIDNLPIQEALTIILQNTPISFKIVRQKQVILYDKNQVQYFTILGEVKDKISGETLPNANIEILGTGLGTQTNREGRFILLRVPARLCTLRTSYIGYRPDTVVIDPINLLPELSIRLQPMAFLSDSVVVHASNYEFFSAEAEPGHYSISPEQFSDLPIIGDKDVFRSLQLLPGISTNLNGTSGVNIRGSSPSENLLLVDGMTLYHADHSFGLLSSISSDVIKDVQLYKSGYPARYGDRLAGVLDITTKSGDLNQFHVSLNMNRLCGQSTVEIPLWGYGSLLVAGRTSYSQYLMDELYQKLTYRPPYQPDSPPAVYYEFVDTVGNGSGIRFRRMATTPRQSPTPDFYPDHLNLNIHFYDLLAKLTLLPSRNDVIAISTLVSDDMAVSQDELDTLSFRYDNQWNSQGSSITWYHSWGHHFESRVLTSYSEYLKNFWQNQQIHIQNPVGTDTTFEYENYMRNKITNFSAKLENFWRLNRETQIDFGLDFDRPEISYSEHWSTSTNNSNQYSQNEQAEKYSAYFQASYMAGQTLNTTVGYRLTYYKPNRKLHHNPRIHLEYHATPDFSLKGSWGRFHQFTMKIGENDQNTATSVFWILANDETLMPSYSEQTSLGFQWKHQPFLLDVEYYYNNFYELPEFFTYFDKDQYSLGNNDGLIWNLVQKDFLIRGVDVLLKKQAGNPGIWVSYGFMHKKFLPRSYQLPMSQGIEPEISHSFKILGNYRIKQFNIVLSYQYTTGKYYTQPNLTLVYSKDLGSMIFNQYYIMPPFLRNQHRLPATSQVDLSINYRFRWENVTGKFSFMVFNLFDTRNIWYRYFYPEGHQLNSEDIYMFGFTPTVALEVKFR